MDNQDIEYICKNLLKTNWKPKLDSDVLSVFDKCDSKLEIMFILGACEFIKNQSENTCWMTTSTVNIDGNSYEGIWYVEPWMGWYLDELPQESQGGPSALLFVPQYKSPEKEITHDLALFYGDDNGSPTWRRTHVIEIDGYGVHSERRKSDRLRDSGLSYPVKRFYEETNSPNDWFRDIVYTDAGWEPN
ncbi:hypothetical protein [Endozoicomonas arenosclerae]|uniref:hypothetical protein n=1 Tax=Endozoicomonas arenosclerae TaxID=1633495 RepID=UPI0007842059|nr:hypothetical protein [Endozoicomonas arenosclerae]